NMAELQKIKNEVEELKKEYFCRSRQAEENRQRENQAATRIQSWVRACKVHAYLSHLHKKAIIIQKIWRGFTARARFRQMVKAAYFIMKMNFYEEMAVRIQRRWRGFFVRKYVHNFYARKSYLKGLSRKNELCPGVFNSPFRPAPHEMELLLRQVKYQAPTRLSRGVRACPAGMPAPTAPSFHGTLPPPWIETTGTYCSSRPILPPIAIKKQQVRCVILIIKDPQHPLLVSIEMALDESRDPLKVLLKKNYIIKTWQTALLGATAESRLVSVIQ
uniref:Spermatogenesis associated 17 n=1 Tax=Cyclopterus lumpus TaxID=8103 RepID=A0A8C2WUD0_CYCLU